MVNFLKSVATGLSKAATSGKESLKRKLEENKKQRLKLRASNAEKTKILRAMTNSELVDLARNFISDNPQVRESKVVNGKLTKVSRNPTRDELIDGLIRKVSKENIFDINSRIKAKFEVKKKAEPKKKTKVNKTKKKK